MKTTCLSDCHYIATANTPYSCYSQQLFWVHPQSLVMKLQWPRPSDRCLKTCSVSPNLHFKCCLNSHSKKTGQTNNSFHCIHTTQLKAADQSVQINQPAQQPYKFVTKFMQSIRKYPNFILFHEYYSCILHTLPLLLELLLTDYWKFHLFSQYHTPDL